MRISKEGLLSAAEATGFRPEMLEKAMLLLRLLEALFRHPFLKNRLVLKGGTALNLFLADLPRLSIDLDLNYVGSPKREVMRAERPKVEEAIRAVCEREGFTIRRLPSEEEHAGGKWSLRYESALGTGGNLAVDLNYMYRVPLWPPGTRDSQTLGTVQSLGIPVLDLHELAAGKLVALLSRKASRDLFDVHLLLTSLELNRERLRLAFVVYGAMSRRNWREVRIQDVDFQEKDLKDQLLPLLRRNFVDSVGDIRSWASRIVEECQEKLACVLPFTGAEMEFLDRLLDHGEIEPWLLTRDKALVERIRRHPMLRWKALNVRGYKGTR
ncbi:nucleotidyl transferase AbiEii/AbiGii toxin family protein [Candidatus Micrarchaeota archaeon]|nr:MAG: nucleotidyl transferase AbiEii/AbiGii toxin family protein [Candidatus Micrarchaeota archaeon]